MPAPSPDLCLSRAVTTLLPSRGIPSSRYNYQLKWWWDLVVVSAAYNRESMARLTEVTADWFSDDANSGRGKALLAPAAALAVQAQNCSLVGASGVDWSLVRNCAPSIMRHEQDVQLLVSTLARVGGNPVQGVYSALVKYGFCMGAHHESGWADATPLLHAIRAVDSEAFVALLLSSVTFCLETEDIVEVSSLGPIKSKKRSKTRLRRLAKEQKRRDKEIMLHTTAFWDRLRLELTSSLRCTSFTSFSSPLFGLRSSYAHARVHRDHVARGSLEERAGVIAEAIELARQTSLDALDGLHATPDTTELMTGTQRLMMQEEGITSTNENKNRIDRGSKTTPVAWRRITLYNINYCEVLSTPVLVTSKSGKQKMKPGRSFLYDVRGTAITYDFLSSYVMCRDYGDGVVAPLDVAGNKVPGGLLQWVCNAGNESLLSNLVRKSDPLLWDAQMLTGALLLLPREPHDTTRSLHAPLVNNIIAHGHEATTRTMLKAIGPKLLDWGNDLKMPLAALAANSTNVASMDLTLNCDDDSDSDGNDDVDHNSDGNGNGNGDCYTRRRGFSRISSEPSRSHLSAPSAVGLDFACRLYYVLESLL